jgi:hypothetical protein
MNVIVSAIEGKQQGQATQQFIPMFGCLLAT